MTFMNDLGSVLLIFGLSRERKGILWFAVGNLVNPEPFVGGSDQPRQVSLDIFDVVKLAGEGISDIDYDDLPVCLSLI